MSKKSSLIMKLSKHLLALAPAMVLGSFFCLGLVGEPKLPEKLKNID